MKILIRKRIFRFFTEIQKRIDNPKWSTTEEESLGTISKTRYFGHKILSLSLLRIRRMILFWIHRFFSYRQVLMMLIFNLILELSKETYPYIPESNHQWYYGFQSPGLRILQAEISRIRDSRCKNFPDSWIWIGLHRANQNTFCVACVMPCWCVFKWMTLAFP